MAQELVYTSAERGLRPGTSGFCTVAMTRGLPPALVPRLEALGGYRPGPGGNGPVAFCFWRVETAAGIAHVLSVVGPAPPDHTARTNKIATYAVLGPDELSAAGPAWMIAQDGFLRRSWKGAAAWIESPVRAPAAAEPGPARCVAWDAACGDAGWAGAVASAFLRDQSKPIHVVYGAGTDPLPLVDEVIRLLPDWARWRATFSTYFLQPVAGTPCALRFCLDGTPAADAARQSKGLVLDLVRPMGEAPDSRHVRVARTGVDAEAAAEARARAAAGKPKQAASRPRTIELEADRDPPLPEPRAARAAVRSQPVRQDVLVEDERPQPWVYAAVAGGATALVLLVIGLILVLTQCESGGSRATATEAEAGAARAPAAGVAPARGSNAHGFGAPTEAHQIEGAGAAPAAGDEPATLPGSAPPGARDTPEPAPEPAPEPTPDPVTVPERRPAPDAAALDAATAPAPTTAPEPTAAPAPLPNAVVAMRPPGDDGSLRSEPLTLPKGAVGARLVPAPSLTAAGACTLREGRLEFGSSDVRALLQKEGGAFQVLATAKAGAVPDAVAAALGGEARTPGKALADALSRCLVEFTDASGAAMGRAQLRAASRQDVLVGAKPLAVPLAVVGEVTLVVSGTDGVPAVARVQASESTHVPLGAGMRLTASRSIQRDAVIVAAVAEGDASVRLAEAAREDLALSEVENACKQLKRTDAATQPRYAEHLARVQAALTDEERAALKLAPRSDGVESTVEPSRLRPLIDPVLERTKRQRDRLAVELAAASAERAGAASWTVRAFDSDGVMVLDSKVRLQKPKPAKGAR